MKANKILPHGSVPTLDIADAKMRDVITKFNENMQALEKRIIQLGARIDAKP